MANAAIEGELRASKGALLFVAKGSRRLLRVSAPSAQVDPGLKSRPVRLRLQQSAKAAIARPKAALSVEPEHGIPERIVGDLEGRDGRVARVRTVDGLLIEAVLPEGAPALEGRVLMEMVGELVALDLEWLSSEDA